MSGVYIKGMEMPTSCGYCRFRYDGICHALQKTQYQREDCPLIPVPPHGRLIESEYLYNAVEQRYRMSSGIEHRCERDLLDVICDAPTIIEAEEGE